MHRKIIHVDMDAFYASIEIRDNPDLRGLPVVVGGKPSQRGVVAAASYEARKYGIRSAMPCSRAYRLCPQAVFIPPQFTKYREVSRELHDVFHEYTDLVEALALDEAWLDVTENKMEEPSATRVAEQIKSQIYETVRLTCSAGVSYNKFLAKIATEENKPNGLFVIPPNHAHDYLMRMSVRKIPSVGKVTSQKLEGLGIRWGQELYDQSEGFLVDHFGKLGHVLYDRVRGVDNRPVKPDREHKSISVETTFLKDMQYGNEMVKELQDLVERLWKRTQTKSLYGRTVTIKVKFKNFQQITRNVSNDEPYYDAPHLFQTCREKLHTICFQDFPNTPIRLIGVGLSNLSEGQPKYVQLELF